MKKKLKQISKTLLLCSMLYFTSCVNDDFIENSNQVKTKSDYVVKKLNSKDLKNNKKLLNKIERFSSVKSNLEQRNIYYSEYGFSIETDEFLFIGNDSIHTYTFNIEKDIEDEYTENLVLKYNGNNNYNAFLIRYNLTEQDKEAIELGQSISNYLKKAEFAYIPEINGSILGTQNRTISYTSIECNDVVIGQDYTINYDGNGVGHWELITYYEVVCEEVTHIVQIIDDGSGGGGGGNDGGNYSGPGNTGGGSGSTGGGGSTGSGNTGTPNTGNPTSGGNTGNPTNADPTLTDAEGNPILTTPILESDPNERKLKKISNNTYVKAKINELRAKCTNPNQLTEDGAQYIKSGSGYTERLPDATFPDETRFDPSFVPNVEVVIHMHELQTYIVDPTGQNPPELVNIVPVFSDGDIYAFLGLAEYTNYANDNITAIVVTPAGTFAMRMDDASKMEQALLLLEPIGEDANGNPIQSLDGKNFSDEYNEKVIQPCSDTDNACFKAAFINFINNYTLSNGQTLGISYYEATFDADGNIIAWTKK